MDICVILLIIFFLLSITFFLDIIPSLVRPLFLFCLSLSRADEISGECTEEVEEWGGREKAVRDVRANGGEWEDQGR